MPTPTATLRNLYTLSARFAIAAKDLAATPQTDEQLAESVEKLQTLRKAAKTILQATEAAEATLQESLLDYRERVDEQIAAIPTKDKRAIESLLAKHGLALR